MIVITSSEDFRAAVDVTTDKPVVAWFTASWDAGCKLVEATMATLAEDLRSDATFVKVDAEQLETLCEVEAVDNFPHFRVFKAGKVVGNFSSTKADKVEEFVLKMVAADAVVAETPEGDEEQIEEAEEGNAVQEVEEVEEVADVEAVDEVAEETADEAEQESTAEVAEDAVVKEDSEMAEVAEADGSKKRQEREDMEAEDEHVVKKAKIAEQEAPGTKMEDVAVGENAEAKEAGGEAQKEQEEATASENIDTAEETSNGDNVDAGEEATATDNVDTTEEVAPAENVASTAEATPASKLDRAEEATLRGKLGASEDGAAIADTAAA